MLLQSEHIIFLLWKRIGYKWIIRADTIHSYNHIPKQLSASRVYPVGRCTDRVVYNRYGGQIDNKVQVSFKSWMIISTVSGLWAED